MRISLIGFLLAVLAIAGCAPTGPGGEVLPVIDINGEWLVQLNADGLQFSGGTLTVAEGQPTTLTINGEAFPVDSGDPPDPNSDLTARITLSGETFSMVVISGETFNFEGQVVDDDTISGQITSPTSSLFQQAEFTLTRQ